jgi:hypothetical protein
MSENDNWKTDGQKQTLLLGAQVEVTVHNSFGHFTKDFI